MTHMVGQPASLDDAKAEAEKREVFAALDRFIVKHYGERCKPYQDGCPCCIAWAMRDTLSMAIGI